jgi:hypothetical protein
MQINSNLPETVIQRWQIVKDGINKNLNSLTESVQQTATQTTDNTKDYLENNWHTVEKITNTTSGVIQKAINTSIHDFLEQYPWIFKSLQILTWGISHPIKGVIFLLFTIAIIWSIIKVIVKIIETASWSILKIPCTLLQKLLRYFWITFTKFEIFRIGKIPANQLNDHELETGRLISTNIYQNKQQRLAEISHRLEVIHNEQQALLREAAKLIKSDSKNILTKINGQETSV